MAKAAYDVVRVSLTSVVSSAPIRSIGNARVAFVGILDSPAGADVSLIFGAGGALVPITDNWTGLTFEPPHDQGIYFTVPSVQVGEVILFIGYDQPCN